MRTPVSKLVVSLADLIILSFFSGLAASSYKTVPNLMSRMFGLVNPCERFSNIMACIVMSIKGYGTRFELGLIFAFYTFSRSDTVETGYMLSKRLETLYTIICNYFFVKSTLCRETWLEDLGAICRGANASMTSDLRCEEDSCH